MGEAKGAISSDSVFGINFFAVNSANSKLEVFPGRYSNGNFSISLPVSFDSPLVSEVITFFASPFEAGSHEPSNLVLFGPDIVLPAPVIKSAEGNVNSVKVSGTALQVVSIKVSIAGTIQVVKASSNI